MFLSACSWGGDIKDYSGQTPKIDFQSYFTGPVKAWGVVQDYRGKVKRRFDIDMVGSWDGDQGTLKEDFSYYDGERQQREWKITRLADNRYQGQASDVIGDANGTSSGNAIRWHYTMDLPVGDTTYKVDFDDWMFLMNDGVLINRSYIKKFGFKVAELTIFMQKQDAGTGE